MRKVLIEIAVPAADINYDVEVSLSCTAGELNMLICDYVKNNNSDKFIPSSDTILIDAKTKKALILNEKLGNRGISNGSKLILI